MSLQQMLMYIVLGLLSVCCGKSISWLIRRVHCVMHARGKACHLAKKFDLGCLSDTLETKPSLPFGMPRSPSISSKVPIAYNYVSALV